MHPSALWDVSRLLSREISSNAPEVLYEKTLGATAQQRRLGWVQHLFPHNTTRSILQAAIGGNKSPTFTAEVPGGRAGTKLRVRVRVPRTLLNRHIGEAKQSVESGAQGLRTRIVCRYVLIDLT